eukprot:TRINITY_DN2334_c0_g1_i1.p2 TRINITY_DN2334_c0_g1~~TRINITY_DN2334_c0_g1_i1.p2  ORF type:complete len:172 (-),score=4.07 TRINITY_DN2334_c0_g1_i1:77-592(-)
MESCSGLMKPKARRAANRAKRSQKQDSAIEPSTADEPRGGAPERKWFRTLSKDRRYLITNWVATARNKYVSVRDPAVQTDLMARFELSAEQAQFILARYKRALNRCTRMPLTTCSAVAENLNQAGEDGPSAPGVSAEVAEGGQRPRPAPADFNRRFPSHLNHAAKRCCIIV